MSDNVFSVATTTLIIDRPSVLCISDADDDDKALWIVEATKALLPQEEGSYDDNGLTISTRPSNINCVGQEMTCLATFRNMEHSHIPIEGLVEHSHSRPFKRKTRGPFKRNCTVLQKVCQTDNSAVNLCTF